MPGEVSSVARAPRPCLEEPAQSVALVITTLCIFSNRYFFNPSATLMGAACNETRFVVQLAERPALAGVVVNERFVVRQRPRQI